MTSSTTALTVTSPELLGWVPVESLTYETAGIVAGQVRKTISQLTSSPLPSAGLYVVNPAQVELNATRHRLVLYSKSLDQRIAELEDERKRQVNSEMELVQQMRTLTYRMADVNSTLTRIAEDIREISIHGIKSHAMPCE